VEGVGFCRENRYGPFLDGGGWSLGHNIDGILAEKVRVPFADTSVDAVLSGVSDEEFLMLADILPTAYEVGLLNGGVVPGDVVVGVGAGPIGWSVLASVSPFIVRLVTAPAWVPVEPPLLVATFDRSVFPNRRTR
jgi:alcohol dehydrogenase